MRHFWVKLQAIESPLGALDRTYDIAAGRRECKAFGDICHVVAMAHPYRRVAGLRSKQPAPLAHCQYRFSVLASITRRHCAAKFTRQELHAVTNAENWHADVEQFSIERRCVLVVYRIWPTRQNDAFWVERCDLGDTCAVWHDDAIYAQFTCFAGDQLRILRTVVEDDERVVAHW